MTVNVIRLKSSSSVMCCGLSRRSTVRIVKLAGATGARPKTGSLVEAHSYSFVIFNPEKMLLVPAVVQPAKRGKLGFDVRGILSASSKKEIKELKALLDQP